MTTTELKQTREGWLELVINEWFKPFFEVFAEGVNFPNRVRVSIGFPSHKATGKSLRTIGQCWQTEASTDNAMHIFISPLVNKVTDEYGILAVLAHELIHACGIRGHGKDFKDVATAIGLEGKMTTSVASAWLTELFKNAVLQNIGDYPNGGLKLNLDEPPIGAKPDKCRLIKCTCDCGYTVRTTRMWIEKAVPICPICKIEMNY